MNTIPCGFSRTILLSHAQLPGTRHCRNYQSCQDVIFQRTTPEYLFCGIADGQSGTERGAEGGHASLEAVADFIDAVSIERLLCTPFPDELPCMIVKSFREKLLSLSANSRKSLREFASTLLAIAVERKTGRFVLIHLGDGCAISIPSTGEPVLISPPENGLTPRHTWLTASDNAVSHLRVTFGSLEGKKRLLLLSDGAVCFCRGRNIPWRVKALLKNGTRTQLQQQLLESDPADDASCIILDYAETEYHHHFTDRYFDKSDGLNNAHENSVPCVI